MARGVLRLTQDYEHWVGEAVPLREEDLERKHALMARDPLHFLRATYYLWLERFQAELPELLSAPATVCIGDLHIENFGTWETVEHHTVWGVNDFDEVAWTPFVIDLVRLASSLRVALKVKHRKDDELERLLAELLDGWRDGVRERRTQIVLDGGEHLHLQALVPSSEATSYWEQLAALEQSVDVPVAARDLVALVAPHEPGAAPGEWLVSWHNRVAGGGSLGHRRLVAVGRADKKPHAREVKELGSPTVAWPPLHPIGARGSDDAWRLLVSEPSRHPVAHTRHEGWQSRALSPDLERIEIAQLSSSKDKARVLRAMGHAIAVVHLADPRSADAAVAAEGGYEASWLRDASHEMTKLVLEDQASWAAKS